MDKLVFLEGMASLAAAYQRELPEETIEAYWRLLRDLSREEWWAITEHAGQTSEHWPTPAKLLKSLGKGGKKQDHGTWTEVAAGSGGNDLGRPSRVGEFAANAWIANDTGRFAYYETMIQNMSQKEMEEAVMRRDAVLNQHHGGGEASTVGYRKFRAEASRLGLASIAEVAKEIAIPEPEPAAPDLTADEMMDAWDVE